MVSSQRRHRAYKKPAHSFFGGGHVLQIHTQRRKSFSAPSGKAYDIFIFESPVAKCFAVMIFKEDNQVGDMYTVDEDTVADALAKSLGTDFIQELIDIAKFDVAANTSGTFT